MFDYAIQNIFKRAVRSILTMLSVTLSICLIIIITGIVDYQVNPNVALKMLSSHR